MVLLKRAILGRAVLGVMTLVGVEWSCGGNGTAPPPARNPSPTATAASPLPSDGTFAVLHAFGGLPPDGAWPFAGLVLDRSGNLYGTTASGGTGPCTGAFGMAVGCGVVFRLAPDGAYTDLHNFGGNDGSGPEAGLVFDNAGNLYGTTVGGGVQDDGVVFKLGPDAMYTVLHGFRGSDGAGPSGGLVLDRGGNLYGTARRGGPSDGGVVFKISPSGEYSVLHSFDDVASGVDPIGTLVLDADGNLDGTTRDGGSAPEQGGGVVFKLASDGRFQVLHSFPFRDGIDGTSPKAGLALDAAGNLYGTTIEGGAGHCLLQSSTDVVIGCGVVFKIAADGAYTVLHNFSGSDGAMSAASLTLDVDGSLYGTTQSGGSSADSNPCVYDGGYVTGGGVVFRLGSNGVYTVLHSFSGNDGRSPEAGLVLDSAGGLYGTTACVGGGGVFRVWARAR
jgi:uncharacterized repeat protein (TIGR03803 family)